ncbi:hypothetical protein [Ramlibacter rhizophilus]|uniref:Uncharacterized protein n=1 Tax=Ramlibacter rhizophilus TaxID=1781167 RepID=A0A4Z0BBK8_9BURK|nr:hypothetical protein [Ramlibacter rhizophilus]TFY96526.1 hypothetical protein EZ242_21120 [Ramlibacter rhizophilus]
MEISRGAGRTFDMQQLDALSKGGKAYTDNTGGFTVLEPGKAPPRFSGVMGALTPMANKQLYAAMLATGRARGQPEAALKKDLAAAMQKLRALRAETGRPPPTNDELMTGGIASMAAMLRARGPVSTQDSVALHQRSVAALPAGSARSAAVGSGPAKAAVVDAVRKHMEEAELTSRYGGDVARLAEETENRLKAANPAGWSDRKVAAGDIENAAKEVVTQFNDWVTGKNRDPLARPDLHTLD